jgi:hypothetical protein
MKHAYELELEAKLDRAILEQSKLTMGLRTVERRLAAVLAIHSSYGVYDECGHDHQEGDPGTIEVEDVGIVCEAGHLYDVCRACHTVDGVTTEDADERSWPCDTRRAAEGK